MRRLSPYVTRLLIATPLSPSAVTALMIPVGLAAALSLSVPGLLGAIGAVLLAQTQLLLDCCDGEVARWRGTSSPLGVYLDRVGHYVAECGIAVAIGVRVNGGLGLSGVWISAGLLLGLLVALNKVENDLVHVARHYAGMAQVRDAEDVRVPSGGLLRQARRIARFVPFHRVFHSIELSLLVLVAALVDLAVEGAATRVLLAGLVAAAVVTVVGHLAAVLSSSRLR